MRGGEIMKVFEGERIPKDFEVWLKEEIIIYEPVKRIPLAEPHPEDVKQPKDVTLESIKEEIDGTSLKLKPKLETYQDYVKAYGIIKGRKKWKEKESENIL
jgi:hypothetical protein